MIKVVIADDEDHICRLIQALVDWNGMGMTIAGTASNGLEALEVVKKENPDILITDIRMPGCSGLELVSRAKKLNPHLHIVIISGYAHFEYAREAILYGVNEYLLKPINKKELIDSLQKIGDRIQNERRVGMHLADIKKDHEKDVTRLRSVFIQNLLENSGMVCSEEALRSQYHFMAQPGCFQIFCMKLDSENGQLNLQAASVVMDKFSCTAAGGLKKLCHDHVTLQRGRMVYGMINYAPKESENIRKTLRDSLNQMDAQRQLLGEAKFSMGLGIAVHSPEELSKSLDTAIIAIDERLIAGTGKLLDGFEKKPLLFEEKLLERYVRNVGQALDILDLAAVEKEVDQLYRAVQENSEAHGWEILEFVSLAGSLFVMRLDAKNKSTYLKEFRESCEDCSTVEMLFENLKNFERKFMNEIFAMRENDSARPVRLAKQYIQNHFQDPISLEEVSERVGLSVAYFSVLFKKETEIGFAKYLTNIRMDEARALLRETNLPVAEICRRVGYYDIKHFTRTFEKIAGVKPAVFRKLYG
jgi:two-component system response regulator YesN